MVSQNPSSWSQQLSWVEYAHNSLPVYATGLSPFDCSLGYQPPIFSILESEVAVPSAHAFVQRCWRTWSKARQTLLQVGARTKAKADRHRSRPPVYVVGQKVWLSSKNIPLRTVCNKLAPKFIGPFTVTKIISPVTVRLKLPPAYRRIHSAFHVSKLKPVFHATIKPQTPVPPPPRLVDGEPVYSVNRILDSRWRERGLQYLVDWEGYGPEERSWVPSRDILDHSLIDDYNRQVSSSGNARRRPWGVLSRLLGLCAHSVSVCVCGPAHCACQRCLAPRTWRGNQSGYRCSLSALPISGWRFCGGLSDRYCSCVVLLSVSLPVPESVLAWLLFGIPGGCGLDWILCPSWRPPLCFGVV